MSKSEVKIRVLTNYWQVEIEGWTPYEPENDYRETSPLLERKDAAISWALKRRLERSYRETFRYTIAHPLALSGSTKDVSEYGGECEKSDFESPGDYEIWKASIEIKEMTLSYREWLKLKEEQE